MTVRSTELRIPLEGHSLVPTWMEKPTQVMRRLNAWNRALGFLLSLVIAVVGMLLLIGGGYTSIQGLRIPIAIIARAFGHSFDDQSFPGMGWWLIPITTNLIQVFCRMYRVLNWLWWPSIIYDSVTTGVFSALALIAVAMLLGHSYSTSYVLCGTLCAVLAYGVSIFAEKLFIGGCRLLWAAATGR